MPSFKSNQLKYNIKGDRERKKILVTGCGRCGTKYISVLLRSIGLHVNHERMGRDGISSWYFAVDADSVPLGPLRSNYDFDYIFHIVRHPMYAIPSIALLSEEAWEFIYRFVPCSPYDPILKRSAMYWYYWNEIAEKVTHHRFQVENISQIANVLSRTLDLPLNSLRFHNIPNNVNTRQINKLYHRCEEFMLRFGFSKHVCLLKKVFKQRTGRHVVTPCDIQKLCPDLASNIQKKASFYGYEY